MADKRKCFVISPIGGDGSETRTMADEVFNYIIRPAVEKCGYAATRSDKINESGIITNQIIERVIEDDLVVAYLTGHNPNVFYELAIRHAVARPYVQVMDQGETLPFDIASTRTVFFDRRSMSSVECAKNSICDHIENSKGPVQSPFTWSLKIKELQESGNLDDRSLVDLISATTEIRDDIGRLGEKVEEFAGLGSEIRHARQRRTLFIPIQAFDPNAADHVMFEMGPSAHLIFVAGFCQGTFPLIYELAMEAARSLRNHRNQAAAQRKLHELAKAVEFFLRSDWGHEFVSRSRDAFRLLGYLEHVIPRLQKH